MKKAKPQIQYQKKRPRILFFDLIRIFCVAAIVYGHNQCGLFPWFNAFFFKDGWLLFNIYSSSTIGLAVFGLIFVSGAVLEYNYQGIERLSDYLVFLFKRFLRLYPAYWLSLLLGILLFPAVLQNNILTILFEFTGFYIILGQGVGTINIVGWFIGTIFLLYILFPYLSIAVKRYQLSSMVCLLIITYASRYYLTLYYSVNLLTRWFPLCNLFEFCLGIYIVQKKFYPKNSKAYPLIAKLSDYSFYVFLFHVVVMNAFVAFSLEHRQLNYLEQIFFGLDSEPLGYLIWYIIMIGLVLLVSWIAMKIDSRIQTTIQNNSHVKRFLARS
jgi:peptidoglycan/LPS O-acetylase OafA/YrhL